MNRNELSKENSVNHPLNLLLPMGFRKQLRKLALATIPSMRHLDMPRRLRHMRRLGFMPENIVDVGAADGAWTRLAASIWPEASIVGFEPNQSQKPLLEMTRKELKHFKYYQAFLGAEQGEVTYCDSGHQTSLLNEQGRRDGSAQATMLVLDQMVDRGEINPPDLIKADVQGYELEVLKGATKSLQSSSAVLLEVSFYRFEPSMPTADEVIDFMRDRGFIWWDIMGILRLRDNDALGQMDLMFVRRDSPLCTRNSTGV